MRIRYFALFAIAALLCGVLVYPMAAHALSAFCAPGAAATVGPTCAPTASPTPTISVPTAMATIGNTFNTLTGASYTTHDMEICYVDQNTGVSSWVVGTGGTNLPGWSVDDGSIVALQSGVWSAFVTHCIRPNEPSTVTFQALGTGNNTGIACLLLRNTGCGIDAPAAEATPSGGGNSTTVTYPQVVTGVAGDMLVYGAAWGFVAATMNTNPSSITVGATMASSSVAPGMQIGYVPEATATTVATTSGTVTSSQHTQGGVALIAPIH